MTCMVRGYWTIELLPSANASASAIPGKALLDAAVCKRACSINSLQAQKKPKMQKEAEAELINVDAPLPQTAEHAAAAAAAPMAEVSTAGQLRPDAAAPAAQPVAQPAAAPPAVAPASEAAVSASPAQALQALPPPAPRWPAQTTPLFLACRYFDRDLAGYIEAADLEEILVMVSHGVSRVSLIPTSAVQRIYILQITNALQAFHVYTPKWQQQQFGRALRACHASPRSSLRVCRAEAAESGGHCIKEKQDELHGDPRLA